MKTNIFVISRLTYFPSTAGLGVDSSLLLSSPFSNEEKEIRECALKEPQMGI